MKILSTIIFAITTSIISSAFAQDTGYEVYLIQKNERLMKQSKSEPSVPKTTWSVLNPRYRTINAQDKTFHVSGDFVQKQGQTTLALCSFSKQLTADNDQKEFIACGKYVAGIHLETTLGHTYIYAELAHPGADQAFHTSKIHIPWEEAIVKNDDSWKNNYSEGYINGFKYVQIWDKL